METIETIDTSPYLNLQSYLNLKIEQDSKTDFITFVRKIAPILVSDWKMGKHIEVISEKLRQLESGEINLRVLSYEQTLELQVNGRQTKVVVIMLQVLSLK